MSLITCYSEQCSSSLTYFICHGMNCGRTSFQVFLLRAASSINNAEFLSLTDFFFPQKGVNLIFFGIFLGNFIGNFAKLHKLGYTRLLWSLNFKRIALHHDINRKQDLYIRVFHKNTFSKEKVVHTLTAPYRAYINHTQKIFFLGQV